MESLFIFSDEIKPVSVNQAIRHGKNGSYKSQAYKDFWEEINLKLSCYKKPEIEEGKPLGIAIRISLPREEYFTKKNTIAKKHDLDNMQKYIIDAVAKYCGFNDAVICRLLSKKVPSDKWRIRVELNYLYRDNEVGM